MEKENKVYEVPPKEEVMGSTRTVKPPAFQLKAGAFDTPSLDLDAPDKDTTPEATGAPHSGSKSFDDRAMTALEKLDEAKRREKIIHMIDTWERPGIARWDQALVDLMLESLSPKPSEKEQIKSVKDRTPQQNALLKLKRARSLDYLLGDSSGELTNDQINLSRKLISQISTEKKDKNGKMQGDYWEQLQGKSVYANQRNVRKAFGEETFFGKKTADGKTESQVGGTCNLASLAMSLDFLGIDIPDLSDQFPSKPVPTNDTERLELVRLSLPSDKIKPRVEPEGWGNVANELGANVIEIGGGVHKRAWWEEKVRNAHLRKGNAVMCSLESERGGHIIRIQAITNEGIIVDDPLGESMPQKGKNRAVPDSINKSNNAAQPNDNGKWIKDRTNNDGKVGNDHLWPWKAVEVHHFRWISAIVPQEQASNADAQK